jgi:hypothetical protein
MKSHSALFELKKARGALKPWHSPVQLLVLYPSLALSSDAVPSQYRIIVPAFDFQERIRVAEDTTQLTTASLVLPAAMPCCGTAQCPSWSGVSCSSATSGPLASQDAGCDAVGCCSDRSSMERPSQLVGSPQPTRAII